MRTLLVLLTAVGLFSLLSVECCVCELDDIKGHFETKSNNSLSSNKVYDIDAKMSGSGFFTKLGLVLSGSVMDKDEKTKAVQLCKKIEGVLFVEDNISVKSTQVVSKKLVFEPVELKKVKNDAKTKVKKKSTRQKIEELFSQRWDLF